MKNFLLTSFENTLTRILFAIFFNFIYLSSFRTSFDQQPYPHGLAHFFDLTFFGDPNVQVLLQVGVVVTSVFYCIGRFMIVSLVFLLIATIGPVTLIYSQGYINHSLHIFPLILLGQLLAYAYSATLKFFNNKTLNIKKTHNLAHFFSRQMIVSIYVAAGISKLLATNGMWALQAVNFAPYVVKTHAEEYYARLDPGILEKGQWISSIILENPLLFVVLLFIALLIELLAFFAISNRNLALFIGVGLIFMHEGVNLIMSVNFRNNEIMIFVFFILPFLTQWITGRQILSGKRAKSLDLTPQTTTKITSILNMIPFKLMLCTVMLGLTLRDWYPFSAFPMFSKLYPQTHYYLVTDENKRSISTWKEFGLFDSTLRKMMTTRLRLQLSTPEGVNESEVGARFLHYLATIRIPKELSTYHQLLLWKATLSLSGQEIIKHEYLVASIGLP